MAEQRFQFHSVNARKDLIQYVEETLEPDVLKKIGENPGAWIDELNIVNRILTREGLVGGTGIHMPPLDDPDFQKLGNNAYFYRGEQVRLRGLWIKKDKEIPPEISTDQRHNWTHYRMGGRAQLQLLPEFEHTKDSFLPENFELVARKAIKTFNGRVEEADKRPILIFPVHSKGEPFNVYAKGCFLSPSYYFSGAGPGFRLTRLAGMQRVTSKKEMKTTEDLARLEVNLPRVLGYYEAPLEEFLFLEEVQGDHPNEHITTHRELLIDQDAHMLAALCLTGYHKQGFANSWDDKVFNGQDLYLIDVDECLDVYGPLVPPYREVLLDPRDTSKLDEFRRSQRGLFERHLQDALYDYRTSLVTEPAHQERYIRRFFSSMKWDSPGPEKIRELTTFREDYMTLERWSGLMADCD